MPFVGNHGIIIDVRIELALEERVFRETVLTAPVGCTPDTGG